jgi:hypothetical protein
MRPRGTAADQDINPRSALDMVAGGMMKISLVQDQAIAARMALIVGADNFDRLFRGIQFDEFDGTVLYAYDRRYFRLAHFDNRR